MEIEYIKYQLNLIGTNISLKTSGLKCYLFGSILENPKLANDIDVLIIYDTQKSLNILKQELRQLMTQYPLHFSYFSISEERELDFIEQQKAQNIFCI